MNDRNDDTGSNRNDPIDADASPSTIESQIDAKRANINATIEQLEQSISPDRAMEYVKANGGEIAQNLGRSFKNNPVPFILTGVGLAWMMSSSQNPPRRDYQEEDYRRYRSSRYGYAELDDGFDDDYDDDYGSSDMSRDGTRRFATYQGGTRYVGVDSDESVAVRDDRLASYGGASYGGGVGAEGTSGGGLRSDLDDGDRDDDDESLLDKARAKAGEIGDGISESARNARERAQQMGDSAGQRYRSARLDARERSDRMRRDSGRRFDRMRGSMRDSGNQLGYNVRSGAESTTDFLREQPLVAGSIGIAIGALLGSLLPATRTEDRYFGERADQLKDEAEERAVEGLERVRGDAEQAASKLRDGAEDAAVRTREKAEQMADKAREEGENKLDEADKRAADKGDVKPSDQSSGDASKSGGASKSTSETV